MELVVTLRPGLGADRMAEVSETIGSMADVAEVRVMAMSHADNWKIAAAVRKLRGDEDDG